MLCPRGEEDELDQRRGFDSFCAHLWPGSDFFFSSSHPSPLPLLILFFACSLRLPPLPPFLAPCSPQTPTSLTHSLLGPPIHSVVSSFSHSSGAIKLAHLFLPSFTFSPCSLAASGSIVYSRPRSLAASRPHYSFPLHLLPLSRACFLLLSGARFHIAPHLFFSITPFLLCFLSAQFLLGALAEPSS